MIKNKKMFLTFLCLIDFGLHQKMLALEEIAASEQNENQDRKQDEEIQAIAQRIDERSTQRADQENEERVAASRSDIWSMVKSMARGDLSPSEAFSGEYDTDKFQNSKYLVAKDLLAQEAQRLLNLEIERNKTDKEVHIPTININNRIHQKIIKIRKAYDDLQSGQGLSLGGYSPRSFLKEIDIKSRV